MPSTLVVVLRVEACFLDPREQAEDGPNVFEIAIDECVFLGGEELADCPMPADVGYLKPTYLFGNQGRNALVLLL